MGLWNCIGWDDDNDDHMGNLRGGGQDARANTGERKKSVRPDQLGNDDDNLPEDNDTRALEWLPISSQNVLAMELVSHLS
jgi:hypothetical protein